MPAALVYHVGSGTSGSRYNQFKTRYSSRNNIYLIYKNMPVLQIILNLPFLVAGFGMKILFFSQKGMGREYVAGIKNGFQISHRNKKSEVPHEKSWKIRQNPAGTVVEYNLQIYGIKSLCRSDSLVFRNYFSH